MDTSVVIAAQTRQSQHERGDGHGNHDGRQHECLRQRVSHLLGSASARSGLVAQQRFAAPGVDTRGQNNQVGGMGNQSHTDDGAQHAAL